MAEEGGRVFGVLVLSSKREFDGFPNVPRVRTKLLLPNAIDFGISPIRSQSIEWLLLSNTPVKK